MNTVIAHGLKCLLIVGLVFLMALPLLLEYVGLRRDQKRKISYKRFRILIFTVLYAIAVTIALTAARDFFLRVRNLPFLQWLAQKVAVSGQIRYCVEVFGAVALNIAVGILFLVVMRFVRIRLKHKDLVHPARKTGYSLLQRIERRVIRFFCSETWFLVSDILKGLALTLSILYGLSFAFLLLPALFSADWIPYNAILPFFDGGYLYPIITLLLLWEFRFFLEGIRRCREECPEVLEDPKPSDGSEVDLREIDKEVRRQFGMFYSGELDLTALSEEELPPVEHGRLTEQIARAIELDERNPQPLHELYLRCLDQLTENRDSVIINGSLFSCFSSYLLRYLSLLLARGDNLLFVAKSEHQAELVCDYLKEGFSQISSLFEKDGADRSLSYDDPIWKIVRISGEGRELDEATLDSKSILVTTLSYLCSSRFESEHREFACLIDTIVLVDTLRTINSSARQLSAFHASLLHMAKVNARSAKNGRENEGFDVRYLDRAPRYICFDDSRTPGLDKVLKNLLSTDFVSLDAMRYSSQTMVRCYRYGGRPDDSGALVSPQYVQTEEKLGPLMNIALLCLAKGAGSVTVFDEGAIPSGNIAESVAANIGQIAVHTDGNRIRIDRPYYNPDGYSIVLAMDGGNDLPATVRRYLAMLPEKPSLLMIFSTGYLLRDYYTANLAGLWRSSQMERIPVKEGTVDDVAERILIKANNGGITAEELLRLASTASELTGLVDARDVNGILRAILEHYGFSQNGFADLYSFFEFVSVRDFDDSGDFCSDDRIMLRHRGKLYDMISGRTMAHLQTGDRDDCVLPVPEDRLTQNYIEGQNLLYGGELYYINRVDSSKGVVYARRTVAGKNIEPYRYRQNRIYRVEAEPEQIVATRHAVIGKSDGGLRVDDVYLAVFHAPMEVLTPGYTTIDPGTMCLSRDSVYHSISDKDDDRLARQCYRRYGTVKEPAYSTDSILETGYLNAFPHGALMMTLRVECDLGASADKTALLAAVALSEILHVMYPSVADAVSVCPLTGTLPEDEFLRRIVPQVELRGEHQVFKDSGFSLLIIEDSPGELGVISSLLSSGERVSEILFAPLLRYLQWEMKTDERSSFLRFGGDRMPDCFDPDTLIRLAGLLCRNDGTIRYTALSVGPAQETCDFCGSRYAKRDQITLLPDGRRICRACAESGVSGKKQLKAYLQCARLYLENSYGITLSENADFAFAKTGKIQDLLNDGSDVPQIGTDIPPKAFIESREKVFVEENLPPVSLEELLVRELAALWQMENLPRLSDELAEGLLALVSVQYLRFCRHDQLVQIRSRYYESTSNLSGVGYRALARELLTHTRYANNPFAWLSETCGGGTAPEIIPVMPAGIDDADLGRPYTPQQKDRAAPGALKYVYYECLPSGLQDVYRAVLEGVRHHVRNVPVPGCTFEQIKLVMFAIRYDRPELFYLCGYSLKSGELLLSYGADQQQTAVMQRQIEQEIQPFLAGIDDSMSAYDVALRLHTRIITAVDYDTVALDRERRAGGPQDGEIDRLRTICGVFLDRKAVCAGYAKAMQYLLQLCGIECAECSGAIRKDDGTTGGGHAWNLLKIDGEYYYLDTTWDDSSDTIQSVRDMNHAYDYFCVTTEEILRTRDLSRTPLQLPVCTARRANYHEHNGFTLEQRYDEGKLRTLAREAAAAGRSNFTVKCWNSTVYETAKRRLCIDNAETFDLLKTAGKQDKRIQTTRYRYSCDDNMWTITIWFCRN